MFAVLLTLHILICMVLVIAILIQSGRGGGLVSAFGTSGGHAIFGGRGAATFLSKATTILGAGFMVTSLLLALLSGAGIAGGPKKGALEKEAERTANEAQSLPPAGQSPFSPGAPEGGAPATAPGTTPSATPGGTMAPGTQAPPAPSGAQAPATTPGGTAPPTTPPTSDPHAGHGH
jgi:preprotein translocase subunit SecG